MPPTDGDDTKSGPARPTDHGTGDMAGNQPVETWMDHERVAALHDGRLSGRERDEVLAGIMANEDEYDLFAETAAVLREIEAAHAAAPDDDSRTGDDAPVAEATGGSSPVTPLHPGGEMDSAAGPGGVIPIDRRRRAPSRAWMAYASLAAGVAAIGLSYALMTRAARPLDDPARAVAILAKGTDEGLATGWYQPFDGTTRGPDDQLSARAIAVRLGAHLVDIELAATARDTTLHTLALKVVGLSRQREMHGGDEITRAYDTLEQRTLPDAAGNLPPGDVHALVDEGRRQVVARLRGNPWFELGMWGEAARTAAARHDAEFFRARAARAALARVIDGTAGDPDVHDALVAIRDTPAPSGAAGWQQLRDSIVDVLSLAGR